MLFGSEKLCIFTSVVTAVNCPLITDLWEAKSSQSYHKDKSTAIDVHGIFYVPLSYPETLTP